MGDTSRKRTYTVGVDLGGTNMLAALVDDQGNILARKKRATGSEEGAAASIDRMVDAILSAVGEGGVPLHRVEAIGIGAPGPLDPERGIVISAPNLKWEPNVPLKDHIEQRVGRPTFLDNDVNVGTLGETVWGAGKGLSNLIGIFVGTGIGGGLILNGELYEGYNHTAGEVGHQILDVDGPVCGCGNKGCLEAFASRTAIERDIRQAIQDGESSMISEWLEVNADAPIKSSVLAKAYRKGDAVVVRVMDKACWYLGVGIGSLVNLLSPEMVILGGGVIEALGKQLLPAIEKTAKAYAFPQAVQNVQIVLAQLGDDAGVLGAAQLAQRKIATSTSAIEAAPTPQKDASEQLTSAGIVRIEDMGFGYIVIDGERYERDVVICIDGTIRKRKKKRSKKKHGTAHVVSANELKAVSKGQAVEHLIVGTGQTGSLSLGEDAEKWLSKKGISYQVMPTPEAIDAYKASAGKTMAFLHVTC